MDMVEFTRSLINIESITGNESAAGRFLHQRLEQFGFSTRRMAVEGERFNVIATTPGGEPEVYFSTHMDTVPPFLPFSEDGENIYGRGACDAKGIIAAQVEAALRLRDENIPVGLLFLVGEERDSLGAEVANHNAAGARFLINGEPTENRLALASKGTLRVKVTARGKMAHSAYPELGDPAIEKLVAALGRLRAMPLPQEPGIGACTMNIGLIEGGRAPNVVPDHASADLLYRLVGPSEALRRQIQQTAGPDVAIEFPLELAFLRFRQVEGIPTMVASFTTDIPKLTNWGEPLLIGPGSIHVAHTDREFVPKAQLEEAVGIYARLAKQLTGPGSSGSAARP